LNVQLAMLGSGFDSFNRGRQRPQRVTGKFIAQLNQLPKWLLVGMTFVILGCVAAMDFVTGYEISCTVFYLVAAGLATWFVGASFGILVSVLSAISTSAISIASGEHYSNRFAPIWDAAIVLSFYLIVVWLLRSLRLTQETLEQRVQQRTASLSSELAERRRLENEILAIGEREQRRIGLDIHDSLCQHLTGTALAEQFLVEKLAARGAPEVADANRVVNLIEDAISLARGLATGLFPLEAHGEDLPGALSELAAHFSTRFKVACRFNVEEPVQISDTVVATHLYRIAQEAVHNAIRHGQARKIDICLAKSGTMAALVISDDGSGIPLGPPIHQGMGLRNMKYRASIIGGYITLDNGKSGATVCCTFPRSDGLRDGPSG
jgi:signal transduction histidine kinase